MLSHGRNREFGRRKEPHRVIIAHGDVVQDFTIRPWVFSSLVILGAIFSILYLSATTYLVFRDEIISFSRSEQAQIQSAYEDQIANLRAQLDRVSSRQMLDKQELEVHVKQLMRKQADYEAYSSVVAPVFQKAQDAGVKIRTKVQIPIPRAAPGKAQKATTQAKANPEEAADGKELSRMAQARVSDSFADLSALGFRSSSSITTTLETSPTTQAPSAVLAAAMPLGLENVDPLATDSIGKSGNPTILKLADATSRLETEMHDNNAILYNILDDVKRKTAKVERRLASLGVKLDKKTKEAIGGPYVPLAFDGDHGKLAQDAEKVALALDNFMTLKRNIRKLPISHPLPSGRLTSRFGARRDPFMKRMAMHSGIDVADRYGTPIRAAGDGTVTHAGRRSGYGILVEINHGNGIVSRYAHMSKTSVKKGQRVSKGKIVGKVGSSGRSTGPHLHFETRIRGKAVNPSSFLLAGNELRSLI